MKELLSTSLRYSQNKLLVLNQQKLPAIEEWLHCQHPQQMHDIIYSLQVRGAPLIGIAAALSLACYAESGVDKQQIESAAALLKSARPTAVNLAHCLDRQLIAMREKNDTQAVITVAEALFAEDAELCNRIASYGQEIIHDGDHIITHCNTGSLVTTGVGTALGVITTAHQSGKKIHVYVDETRPLLQGARLTVWELAHAQVPYTLICDNMAAMLMRSGKINKAIVGADRIAKNGDFANKIGTYGLAVLAHYHRIPFYVAAPYTTIDLDCPDGNHIHIEERAADEVRGAYVPGHGQVVWSVENCPAFNPAFDVTPADLVTGYILDSGLVAKVKS